MLIYLVIGFRIDPIMDLKIQSFSVCVCNENGYTQRHGLNLNVEQ